jgi:hypothetical protein
MLPLKGWNQARLAAFGDDQIARFGAAVLDMRARRVEVRVVGDDLARPADHRKEDVFGRAALMCRE